MRVRRPRRGVGRLRDRPCGPPATRRGHHRRDRHLSRRAARDPAGRGRAGLPHRGGAAAPGSLLVLYTDGLIEARDRDLDQGMDELAQALRGAEQPLDALCDGILRRLLPCAQQDDVAVLLARAGPV
ncbi:SpoIIE family protein phosphatase [Streptomyces sp. MS1.HAVA.3]|uniref:SpoIIE family protein phosphatase n=1 Tax=Streptomyces caledonius TaxID=3134107 RepID=A0ABU8U163_9ACTN